MVKKSDKGFLTPSKSLKLRRAKIGKEHKGLILSESILSESMLKEKTIDDITESLLIAVAQAADKASKDEGGNEKWFIFDGYIDYFIINLLNARIRLKRFIDSLNKEENHE